MHEFDDDDEVTIIDDCLTSGAEVYQQHGGEEWQPGDQEAADDDGNGHGQFYFLENSEIKQNFSAVRVPLLIQDE